MTDFSSINGKIYYINSSDITDTTVRTLIKIVNDQKRNVVVRELVENLVASVPEKNYRGEIERIFNYVKNHMRYTRDINGVEFVRTPLKHIELIRSVRGFSFGDCDDHSVLLATLLESGGYKARFAIIQSPDNPRNTFNHIYVEVLIPPQRGVSPHWLSLDATVKNRPFGWSPEYKARKIYNI